MALSDQDKLFDATMAAVTADGGQLALGKVRLHGHEYPVFANAPASLRDYAAFAMAMNGDKDAIVYEDERYTFADVQQQAVRIAALLQARFGIAKGDRVAIAMRNYPEWITSFLGATMLGAVVVSMNAWWTAEGLGYGLDHSGARLVIADEQRLRLIASVKGCRAKLLAVRTTAEVATELGAFRLEDMLAKAPAQPEYLPPVYPDDDALLMYTSGSTGTPKGAISTQQAVVSATLNFLAQGLTLQQLAEKRLGRPAGDQAILVHVPLFHITGLVTVFLVSLAAARKMVIMYRWDAGKALQLIEREKCTFFLGVPSMLLELMQHPDRDRYDLSSLTDMAAGGAPQPPEHVKRLAETFPNISPTIGYGLTETNGIGSGNFGPSYLRRPDSAGRFPGPLVERGIFDDAMQPVPVGQMGEVCIRTIANARGYWLDPQATAENFTRDGWFRTGDVGRMDEDGYLFIIDRKKDIIIRGGENISAVEVEAAIYANPAVAEAAVFGLPDARLGEVVGAVVHLQSGEKLSAEALTEFVASRLASFKVPVKIWLTDKPLPRLGAGKIDKMSLRHHYRPLWQEGKGEAGH